MRTAIIFALLIFIAADAAAQPAPPQGPVSRPTVSPYINLLGNNRNNGLGGSTLQGLYGIVRPEQTFRQQNSQLQQQLQQTNQNLNAFQQTVASADGTNPLITGKGATFNNTSHYFNNLNGGGGGGGFGGFGGSGGMSSGFNSRGSGVQAPQGGSGRSKR